MSTSQRRIDKYQLEQRLGYGGMAEVWKAYDPHLQRYVAVKILHPDLLADPEFMQRFIREARVIASLSHPNIVQLHDFQISKTAEPNNTIAYMVMEYIEGPTLADYIKQTSFQGKFPPATVILNLFASISRAVDYAHQQGMIHRDIKPANILLDSRRTSQNPIGEPILTDFGIARLMGQSSGAMSATWLGTALYISPEQAKGYPGNERSDLYALGVILYEICTGVYLFQGETPAAIMTQHINNLPTPPALINPHIPPALSMVILRSLAKDPGARFSSAGMMAVALAEAFNLPAPENLSISPHSTELSNEPTYIAPQGSFPSGGVVASAVKEGSQGTRPQETPSPAVTPAISSVLPSTPTGPSTYRAEMPSAAKISAPITPLIAHTGPSSPVSEGGTPVISVLQPVYSPSVAPNGAISPPPVERKRRRRLLIGLLLALVLLLAASGLTTAYLLTRPVPVPVKVNPLVGYAFFTSSGQLYDQTAQGINDELRINLQNIPAPASGKNYYAWLLGDLHATKPVAPILLGELVVIHGNANLTYSDPQHKNLIGMFSRFLITEESGTPTTPSTNQSSWRYFAELPQDPAPKGSKYRFLDDIRHILYEGASLPKQGIHGGLDSRTLRNMQSIWEWASSARGSWREDSNFIHRQLIRILEAADGQTDLNLYVNPKAPILVDPAVYQLRTSDSLLRIDEQLRAMIVDPAITPALSGLTKQALTDIANIRSWQRPALDDVRKLIKMTNTQLQSQAAFNLLNDLQTLTTYAFIGKIDSATGTVLSGTVQMHYTLQQLATFDVMIFTHSSH